MADIYIHHRLGESRAAVCEKGRLVEMHLQRAGDGVEAGSRVKARLKSNLGTRGIAVFNGEELLVEPWPKGKSEGAEVVLDITRAAWRETARARLAKARPTQHPAEASLSWEKRFAAVGKVHTGPLPEAVEEQWAEAYEAATLGRVTFAGGSLCLEPTAAFLAVDVDGAGLGLMIPAVQALARVIRLYGLGGNIVIDLPHQGGKADRVATADAFDAAMAGQTFERTAVNGFGMMQIVRHRPGPSILERARFESAATEAVALVQQALKAEGAGALTIKARPAVIRWLEQQGSVVAEASSQAHRPIHLQSDPLSGSGHVSTAV